MENWSKLKRKNQFYYGVSMSSRNLDFLMSLCLVRPSVVLLLTNLKSYSKINETNKETKANWTKLYFWHFCPVSFVDAFSGDFRNDLYLTLCKGEFEKGSKTAGKNIEVHVIVVDKDSQIVPVIWTFILNLCIKLMLIYFLKYKD